MTKFELFPKLVPEIRLDIWHWAIELDDEPRIFEVGMSDDIESIVGTPTIGNVNIARWSCPPHPALMSVCYESRVESQKRYQALKFRNRTIFIKFEIDWIFLPEWSKYDGLVGDRQWWVWKEAFENEGYWPMIRNLAVPASVWCQLSWTEDLVNGTIATRWAKELEGMPFLKEVVMAFEVWAQHEDDRLKRFSSKGNIGFANVAEFDFSGSSVGQWIEYAKSQIEDIKKLKLSWKIPEITFASVTRGGKEPLMHGVMRKYWKIEPHQDEEDLASLPDAD